jgi:3-hydroxyisobutyrate dehydrogenase
MMERIAFIGLGIMGHPMAGHLRTAGHEVVVHNRSPGKAERWVAEYGGRLAHTPAEAAARAAVVFACVGADEDVREVTIGPSGAFRAMPAGSVFVDHTTTSATVARELSADAHARGLAFVDAPVSGGQAGAEGGTLTVMAGGAPEAVERVRPLVETYARQMRRLGPSGSGQLAKMVNQICVAGLIEALAEGLHFARAAGLDAEAVVDVISKGAAQSFGFAVDWMRKDLGIALREAAARGVELPVTGMVDRCYAEVQAMGGGRWDTSSLLARLEATRTP